MMRGIMRGGLYVVVCHFSSIFLDHTVVLVLPAIVSEWPEINFVAE